MSEALLQGGAALRRMTPQQSVFDEPFLRDELLRVAGISPELSRHPEFEPLQRIFSLSHESQSLLRRIEDDRNLSLFEKLRLRADVDKTFMKLDRLSSELGRNFSGKNIQKEFDSKLDIDQVYTSQHVAKEIARKTREIEQRENRLLKEQEDLGQRISNLSLIDRPSPGEQEKLEQYRQRYAKIRGHTKPEKLMKYRRKALAQFQPVEEELLSKNRTLQKIRRTVVPYSEESYRFLDFYLSSLGRTNSTVRSALKMFGHAEDNSLYSAFLRQTEVCPVMCFSATGRIVARAFGFIMGTAIGISPLVAIGYFTYRDAKKKKWVPSSPRSE